VNPKSGRKNLCVFHVIVNGFPEHVVGVPQDRNHFGAARGEVFTLAVARSRSWQREPAAGDIRADAMGIVGRE
jgi:hypothetical protein